MSITPIIVDDRDASIAYSAGWTQMGSNFELDSTTAGTTIKGVTSQYTFLGTSRSSQLSFREMKSRKLTSTATNPGTSIAVFGTIPDLISFPNDTVSSYSIDGGPTQNFTGTRKTETQYRVQFYRSSALAPGQHTIRITNLVEGGALFLDYFEFTPSIDPSSMSSSSMSQSTLSVSSPSSTSFSSTSLSSTDLSLPPPTATSQPIANKVLIRGIVGVTVGVLALLGILAIFLLLRRRKNRRNGKPRVLIDPDVDYTYNRADLTPKPSLAHYRPSIVTVAPPSSPGDHARRGDSYPNTPSTFHPHTPMTSTANLLSYSSTTRLQIQDRMPEAMSQSSPPEYSYKKGSPGHKMHVINNV